jgi:hypothetical protein
VCERIAFRFKPVAFGPVADNPERGVVVGRDRVEGL